MTKQTKKTHIQQTTTKMQEINEITELENQVLQNIVDSEFMEAEGLEMIGFSIWSYSATNEDKQLAGALGSLVKKGLCATQDYDSDSICWLTADGYQICKEMNIINHP